MSQKSELVYNVVVKILKSITLWISLPLIFPVLLGNIFSDTGRASWKIWLIQVAYLICCLYGFLDWLNGWTPDPVVPPEIYIEPSDAGCDSGFYASANGC
jgi:hypothetical protein